MPMNVRVTAVATVRWKCPATNSVLCTTRFTSYEAFTSPPMPPNANRIIARFWAAYDGSCHGSAPTHANRPRPPRARAPISSEAITVNAVIMLGKNTA